MKFFGELIESNDQFHSFYLILFNVVMFQFIGAGGDIFENDFSDKILDRESSTKMWDYSSKIVGVNWPKAGPESLIPQEIEQQKIAKKTAENNAKKGKKTNEKMSV